jgi:DNA-binding HxlR family transcriptional regulator
MARRRTYGDACGIARALDIVGERWALMVVREMLLGPKRFTDIREGLPHVSPDVLAQRLRELETAGVVRKRTLPPPAASQVYELTPSGLALEPAIVELGRWGGANAAPPEEGMGMSLDSHVVSLRTLFVPELAEDFDARVDLRLGDQHFRAMVAGGEFEIIRGEGQDPDATIDTDPGTLIAVAHGHRTFGDALEDGTIRVEGDEEVAERFFGLFPLPAPAL